MNTSLLFSSFPFITGQNVTLSRMTDMDAEALWEVLGDEENFRYAPTAPLPSPVLCEGRMARYEAMFRDRVAIVLGIYPCGGGNPLGGIFEIYNVDPQIESVTVRFTLSRPELCHRCPPGGGGVPDGQCGRPPDTGLCSARQL